MNGHLHIVPTAQDLVRVAAERIEALLLAAVKANRRATIALSGGSTPRDVYARLGTMPAIPWSDIHLFWGDERCVPPDHPESNFRMVREALLSHIDVPPQNVHRIKGELKAVVAAREYEKEISRVFGSGVPRFDVILLGLGEDGHTASLFPHTTVLKEQTRLVADVYVERLNARRITLTLPVINNASTALFLISGKGKAQILDAVFNEQTISYPAQLIRPASGELQWLVDQDAASQLVSVGER